MATVEVSFVAPAGIGPQDNAYPDTSELITSSGSNQVSTGAALNTGVTAIVHATGGAVKISIGAAPDATTDTKPRLVGDGQVRAFTGVAIGHKVAVVDA